MKLLLDTCTFLWMISGAVELSETARALVVDPDNDAYVSAASAWEIALKYGLGKLPLPSAPEEFVPRERERHRLEPLAIDEAAALHLRRLPDLHRDPFDRMLVSQAILGGLTIVTPDLLIAQYPVPTRW